MSRTYERKANLSIVIRVPVVFWLIDRASADVNGAIAVAYAGVCNSNPGTWYAETGKSNSEGIAKYGRPDIKHLFHDVQKTGI